MNVIRTKNGNLEKLGPGLRRGDDACQTAVRFPAITALHTRYRRISGPSEKLLLLKVPSGNIDTIVKQVIKQFAHDGA